MDTNQQMQEFRTIVEKNLKLTSTMFTILGVLAALLGLGMALAYFVPSEETTPIAVVIIGIILLVAGIAIIAYARSQSKNTLDLLFHRTDDIEDIKLVIIKRGNMGNMYALHFVDKNKTKRGVMVPSESYAEAIKRMYLG